MYRNNTNARSSRSGSGANSPQEGGARMKPWRWSLWAALIALTLVGLSAMPAQAAFSDGTTISVSQLQAAPADCNNLVWRTSDVAGGLDSLAYKRRWFNYAGPTSTNVPILSFRIDNGDGTADTLYSMYVHSIAERTNTISQIRLYWDSTVAGMSDTNAFYGGGNDVFVGSANPGAFQTNDSVFINLTRPIIVPGGGTAWFNMVVDINGIGNNPTYDMTGVGVELRPERVCMGAIGCGPAPGDTVDLDCIPQSPANNAYSIIIDNQGPACDSVFLTNYNINNCLYGGCDPSDVINLGDSLLIQVDLDIVNVPNDTCKTGWPKVFVREFTNNAGAVTMARFKGFAGYQYFAYVNEYDSSNIGSAPAVGPFDLMNVGPTVNLPVDIPGGTHWIVAEFQDAYGNTSRCSTLVAEPIDTKKPAVAARPASWTLHWDANGNGIVNPGDTVRFFIDMSNEPFGEVCAVFTTIYDFYAAPVGITLYDDAGDRRFEAKHEVLPGVLDGAAESAWLHVVDNACNEDSLSVTLAASVDNVGPSIPPGEFLRLSDTDLNGCLKIGESVRIRVQGVTDTDLVAIYANVMQAGLGDLNNVAYSQYPLNNLGGGNWQLDWVLGDLPQDSAIDYGPLDPNAIVALYIVDNAQNWDTVYTTVLDAGTGGYSIDTDYPEPVVDLACYSRAFGVIDLEWNWGDQYPNGNNDIALVRIYYDNGTGGDPNILVAEVGATTNWTTDGTVVLTDGVVYKWRVEVIDDCGNVEVEHVLPVACESDASAPITCVYQPEEGQQYSCSYCEFLNNGPQMGGFFIYVKADLPGSDDLTDIDTVLVRLKDQGDGNPGPWTPMSFDYSFQGPSDNLIAVWIYACEQLDAMVGDGDVEDLEIIVIGSDEAGNVMTRNEVIAACGTWEFTWANTDGTFDLQVTEVNGQLEMYQNYCDITGFSVWGPSNTVEVCFSGGLPPYKIRMEVGQEWAAPDNEVVYVENVYAACTTLTFSAEGFWKGVGEIDLYACDAAGANVGEVEYYFCVADSIPPCALISNPVDGKCIRRSRSMLDPVEICVVIDPMQNCLDPDEVVKIDYEWSKQCCQGLIIDTTWIGTWYSCDDTSGNGENLVCDTVFDYYGPGRDSITCRDTTITPACSTLVWTPEIDTVPCEDLYVWNNIAVQAGPGILQPKEGGPNGFLMYGCVDWWNTEDLSWITESGTIIYLRARLFDDQGNEYITPCVQVCVDIDTPPLCLETPDFCYSDGKMALSAPYLGIEEYPGKGLMNDPCMKTFYADLDLAQDNIDDLDDVFLYYKKSSDPDQYDYWYNLGSGLPGVNSSPGGTNSTVWRWDINLCELELTPNVDYDFRVIARTVWGTWSHDMNGDGWFDANTFDSSACDMATFFIDAWAPNAAIDTVWTEINGQLVVQPNVSCVLSDPRGWAFTQWGNTLTVQPNVWPWFDTDGNDTRDDVKRVEWTLFTGEANCDCDEQGRSPYPSGSLFGDVYNLSGYQSWTVQVNEGANVFNNLVFDPTDAPWYQDMTSPPSGYEQVVLLMTVWDGCGNMTQDCITIYLLDIDPTDAIIVEPDNDEVFCTAPGNYDENGIYIEARSILEEGWNKAVFAYRPLGATEWVEFDSVGVSAAPDVYWQWFSTYWNPTAFGLADGTYELTVWAVDNALNRSENLYITTVHLSCALPTVAVVYPTTTDPAFIGCDIELEAVAESTDPRNPITEVAFYYVRVIDDIPEEEYYIGSDYESIDGRWGYNWIDPDFEGPHFIFARAWNKSGQMVQSDLVWVRGDDTDPYGIVAQVGDDLSNGGYNDPTIVQAGSVVDIWGYARDNDGGWGQGEVDNCGVDSVIFYIKDGYEKMDGFVMTPDNVIDSLYTGQWNTANYEPGTYRVKMKVFDCACNDSWSESEWYVRVVGPDQDPQLAVDGPEVCGYVSVDQEFNATVTVNNPSYVSSVYLAWISADKSDVEDQYWWSGELSNDGGGWTGTVYTDGLDEGLYRLRAVVYYTDGSSTENGFDDFTFDETKGHHMFIRVDHSASAISVTHEGPTFKAHEDICLTTDATEDCDIEEVLYGVGEGDDTFGASGLGEFCFDPLDSSGVTLNNCNSWTGDVVVTAVDYFGHVTTQSLTIWILDVNANQVAITNPSWSAYITPNSNAIEARKLSSSGIDSVQFFASTSQTNGTLRYIGSSAASGDEFSTSWNVDNVPEGQYWLFGKAFDNGVGVDGPRCPATVAKACSPFALTAPSPSYQRTVNGTTFTFVGEHTDLCVDRATISNYQTIGLDSIVWYFRNADVPGVDIEDNLDPNLGWVRIDADVYGSLCVDWFTNWCDVIADYDLEGEYGYEGNCCPDGRYTIVARVFDKAGNECHSIPMNVMIDVTDPYSEIVDIDGDETFGTCHEVVLPEDDVVKLTANAIDDHSCVDMEPYKAWNSGAKYLQFFVGRDCAGGGGGCVDIVFVQDGSGSMADEQQAIATNAQLFTSALGNVDFRLGVLGYDGDYEVINLDGSRTTAAPGNGVFTTDVSAFQTMITAVGDQMGGTENGLTALNTALTTYPWRSNCTKVMILVTDEDADDFADYASLFPPIVNSGAAVFGVINFADSAGYSNLGSATGGQLFDITANWGANLAAVASGISALAGGAGNDVGIVWGQTVTLNDGQDNAFALWNPTGLEPGSYCAWTVVVDNVGNSYVSGSREICIVDQTPPVAHITGFGKSTDEHMVNKYTIYGATWDTDVDYVQFQYRPTGSTNATDWTGIGISAKVNGDSTCWMTTWNPCVLSGSFDLRVVPTDKNGNQDFAIQPIATVTINNCNITPSGASTSAATIWFEDRTFEDLGLVHVDQDNTSDDYHNLMMAVWADLKGSLDVEKIELWAPDPDIPSWKSGSFEGSQAIKMGGEGWFWQSYTDASNRTHLKKEVMTVWRVKAAIGACNSTHPTLGAKVCIEPGALSADNGIVVFPARVPTLNLSQQHFQAWPAYEGTRFPLVTAIRLTDPVWGFNDGKYAQITLRYVEPEAYDPADLGVAWWDEDQWNTNDGLIAAGEIGDGSATFHSDNLYGLYSVVSAGRNCNSGAITVENAGAEFHVGNVLGPRPTIYTRVRSNIEYNNQNRDINEDEITVVLDGNITVYANGDNPDNGWYDNEWDEVTGILTTHWESDAPALAPGPHTLMVQAFNKSGYCKSNTYAFTVDAAKPDVEITGMEVCPNPTFHIKITDAGAGVNWEKVFVDVYDITGSEFSEVPKAAWIHTETFDAFNDENFNPATGEFSFQLVDHIAQGRRLRAIVYAGPDYRWEKFNEYCNCIIYEYDWEFGGVADMVENYTQVVQEDFTVAGGCDTDGDGIITIVGGAGSGSSNPFDPWAGGAVSFALNGFDGGGVVTAEIYDLAGEKVATIFNGQITSTVGTVTWTGTNDDGEYVAEGVYLAYFKATGAAEQVLKVVVKRGVASN